MLSARLRSTAFGLMAGIAAALVLTGPVAFAGDAEVRARTSAEISVGAQLEALQDVTLGQAELVKGSKVNVVKVLHRKGNLASIDVELADGHVARAPATTIRTFFRLITN